MSVPEFVKIEQDPENRRLALSVANSDITEQKEMWGMFDLTFYGLTNADTNDSY